MALELYRNTVIGETLKATLDEMIAKKMISQSQCDGIFEKFDKVPWSIIGDHNIFRL